MKNGTALIGLLITGVVGYAIGFSAGVGRGPSHPPAPLPLARGQVPLPSAPPPALHPPQPAPDQVFRVPIGESPTRGPADALVTIVEFSDFQCPFCARAFETLEDVLKKHPDVRLVFKHYPLVQLHPNATPAAQWAIAAAQQGKFWSMHDHLFRNQQALDRASLEKYAADAGLDVDRARSAVDGSETQRALADDQALAAKLGVQGTPTFFIDGVRLVGAVPAQSFEEAINRARERAEKAIERGAPREAIYDALMKDAQDGNAGASLRTPRLTAG